MAFGHSATRDEGKAVTDPLFGQLHHLYYVFVCGVLLTGGGTGYFALSLHQEITTLALCKRRLVGKTNNCLKSFSLYMLVRVCGLTYFVFSSPKLSLLGL